MAGETQAGSVVSAERAEDASLTRAQKAERNARGWHRCGRGANEAQQLLPTSRLTGLVISRGKLNPAGSPGGERGRLEVLGAHGLEHFLTGSV